MKCKYCGNADYYFVLSLGKIDRFGLYCSECNRHDRWVSKADEHKIKIGKVRDSVGKKKQLKLL